MRQHFRTSFNNPVAIAKKRFGKRRLIRLLTRWSALQTKNLTATNSVKIAKTLIFLQCAQTESMPTKFQELRLQPGLKGSPVHYLWTQTISWRGKADNHKEAPAGSRAGVECRLPFA